MHAFACQMSMCSKPETHCLQNVYINICTMYIRVCCVCLVSITVSGLIFTCFFFSKKEGVRMSQIFASLSCIYSDGWDGSVGARYFVDLYPEYGTCTANARTLPHANSGVLSSFFILYCGRIQRNKNKQNVLRGLKARSVS